MPKILLHCATAAELEPAIQFLQTFKGYQNNTYKLPKTELTLCVSGAGMVKTAFALGQLSDQTFDLAIQAGIAGCFTNLAAGTLVRVDEDCFSEMGAQDNTDFLSMDTLGLGEQKQKILYPYRHRFLDLLPKMKGITVNTVHGNEQSIQEVIKLYQPDVESMEGAAFVYAANQSGWPALQLRSISNKVEKRNRAAWNIPVAIHSLNTFLINFLKELNEH
jgi:futalosine hydrolase